MTTTVERRWRNRGLIGVLVLGLGVWAACDGGTDPDDGEDPGNATIVASVTTDGSAAQGVSLALYVEGGMMSLQTATTNASGEAEFTGLEAGTYDVEITVPSGQVLAGSDEPRKAITVGQSGEATVEFALVTQTTATDTVEVSLTNYAFTPGDLTIAPGTMVRWVNDTNTFHTVTPDGHSEWTEGSVSNQGETFTHVFNNEGTFPYYCSPHQSLGMTGTVTVQAP